MFIALTIFSVVVLSYASESHQDSSRIVTIEIVSELGRDHLVLTDCNETISCYRISLSGDPFPELRAPSSTLRVGRGHTHSTSLPKAEKFSNFINQAKQIKNVDRGYYRIIISEFDATTKKELVDVRVTSEKFIANKEAYQNLFDVIDLCNRTIKSEAAVNQGLTMRPGDFAFLQDEKPNGKPDKSRKPDKSP